MINQQTTFGIEIETQVPSNISIRIGYHGNGQNVTQVTLADGSVVNAPRFAGECWKADEDPSIRTLGTYRKCEFVSPILKGDAGMQHILEFLTFLKTIGAKRPVRYSGSTQGGIHVTIHAGSACGSNSPADIRNWCEKLARLGVRMSPVLYGQNAERRDLSQWSPIIPTRSQQEMIDYAKSSNNLRINIGKYALINFSKMQSIGCVEFRSFATTLNPNKIMLIVTTCLTMCQEACVDNLPKWASVNRLRNLDATYLFWKFYRLKSRCHVTKTFRTLGRIKGTMYNWGYASCAWYNRLRSIPIPAQDETNSEALALMQTPLFNAHVRGTI